MRHINSALQLVLAVVFLAEGTNIAINGRWWSAYGQYYSPVVEMLVHTMGVGLVIFSIFYASFVIKDIKRKKASREEEI